jgi:hypothetical protein
MNNSSAALDDPTNARVALIEACPQDAPLEQDQVIEVDHAYETFVLDLATRKDPKTFSNQSRSHALTILRNVFESAERYVDIFSGELFSPVYNDKRLLVSVRAFVSKGGEVNILLQKEIPKSRLSDKNDFLNIMYDKRDKGCSVKIVNKSTALGQATSHFLVSDDRMYRVELDTVKHMAVCSFQERSMSVMLKNLFNKYITSPDATNILT